MDKLIKMLNSCYKNEIPIIFGINQSGLTMYNNVIIEDLTIEDNSIKIFSDNLQLFINRNLPIIYDSEEDEYYVDDKICICGG